MVDLPDDSQSWDGGTLRLNGTVMAVSRGFYEVQTNDGVLLCTLRGRLRKELVHAERQGGRKGVVTSRQLVRDPVAVGDMVHVLLGENRTGVIEIIHPRERSFARSGPETGALQTMVAGIDQIIVVFAAQHPAPHLTMLDRFLVLAHAAGLDAAIVINKIDLGVPDEVERALRLYRRLGYPVVTTSVGGGDGIDELQHLLVGKTSALVGPSGVGKTSLLNRLEPTLGQRVRAVSNATGKGLHTTVGSRLFPLSGPGGGYLADTAGLRELSTATVSREDLPACFPEFQPLLDRCTLRDCTHLQEPGCAITEAVRIGAVDASRYRSYRHMRLV